MQQFRICHANFNDFNGLLDFYETTYRSTLPLETAKTIGDAIENGRMLLVKNAAAGRIVSAGALFQLTPLASLTSVSELAGRVTGEVGGLRPLKLQAVLIGLRLLSQIASEAMTSDPRATQSIIAAVREDNGDSIANLEKMGMKYPVDPMPDWLRYNQIGWHNAAQSTEPHRWRFYFADAGTCRQSIDLLDKVGLFTRTISLERDSREDGDRELFRFELELDDINRAALDFKAMLRGQQSIDMVPPPPTLTFP
ncbi:MAG: hypothetical protein JSR61_13655 [Proteobacteria bacterium]|nr:hypothetical protein [Pseudomonadota bacterium]